MAETWIEEGVETIEGQTGSLIRWSTLLIGPGRPTGNQKPRPRLSEDRVPLDGLALTRDRASPTPESRSQKLEGGLRLSLPRSRLVSLEFFLSKVPHGLFVGAERRGIAFPLATRLRSSQFSLSRRRRAIAGKPKYIR